MQATAGELAEMLGGRLEGCADIALNGVQGLEHAGPSDLTFISAGKWATQFASSNAKVALVTEGIDVPGFDAASEALIVVANAEFALITLLEAVRDIIRPLPEPGVHPTAVVHEAATLGKDVFIDAYVVIGKGAVIGDGAQIHSHAVVADGCTIGARTVLFQKAVVGGEGYGVLPHPETGMLTRVPHLGSVVIGDDVEIGVGTCVDRGKFGPTTIGDGTKMDNLVQIGHNVTIGRNVIISAHTGVGGTAHIHDNAMIGARVGIVPHVVIGEGAQVAGASNVLRDVPAGAAVGGTPAIPIRDKLREIAALRRLPELVASSRSRRD
ncbi:MAG: hypothetical protein MK074_07605 [Phycisphaerales bacterium]|nr:hypothetical protein [Phycisphaerales bacterium]